MRPGPTAKAPPPIARVAQTEAPPAAGAATAALGVVQRFVEVEHRAKLGHAIQTTPMLTAKAPAPIVNRVTPKSA